MTSVDGSAGSTCNADNAGTEADNTSPPFLTQNRFSALKVDNSMYHGESNGGLSKQVYVFFAMNSEWMKIDSSKKRQKICSIGASGQGNY